MEREGDVVGAEHHQPRRRRHRHGLVQRHPILRRRRVTLLSGAVGVGRRLWRVPDRPLRMDGKI